MCLRTPEKSPSSPVQIRGFRVTMSLYYSLSSHWPAGGLALLGPLQLPSTALLTSDVRRESTASPWPQPHLHPFTAVLFSSVRLPRFPVKQFICGGYPSLSCMFCTQIWIATGCDHVRGWTLVFLFCRVSWLLKRRRCCLRKINVPPVRLSMPFSYLFCPSLYQMLVSVCLISCLRALSTYLRKGLVTLETSWVVR